MADTSISHLFFDDSGTDSTVLEFPNRVDGMLADLLAAASAPGTASELSGERQARAIFASTAANWSKPKRRVRPARVAVVAVSAASLLATTTTVLAAASVLPPTATKIVDKALRHVDINIAPPAPSQIGGLAPTPPRSGDATPVDPTYQVPSASVNVAQAAPPAPPASVPPAGNAPNANAARYSAAVAAAAAAATGHEYKIPAGTQNTSTGSGATYMGGNQPGGAGGGSASGTKSGSGETIPVEPGGTPPTVTKGSGSTPPTVTKGSTPPTVTKGTPPSVVNQAPRTGSGQVAPTAGGDQVSGTVEQEVNGPGTQKATPGGPIGTNTDETTANQ